MKKLKSDILSLRSNKYQNSLWNLNKIKKYYKYKDLFIKKNFFKQQSLKLSFTKYNYISNGIITSNFLKELYLKKLKKKDLDLIYIFYKKYSSNLILKKKYDKKLKKISNQSTVLESYLFLGLLAMKLKLNNIMKLNFLLKINDHIFLHLSKLKNVQNKYLFSKLLILEITLLKKIIKI